ncbi:hypothetical protein LXL04_013225 [Taraxacum kok-saghyz]
MNISRAANALGDPSVTLEQVTPVVIPSGPLFPPKERIVKLFENNTYSVVNIFDVTLRPQLNVTGVVDVILHKLILDYLYIPKGNGSRVVWDEEGHIVTNYHVIGNSLSRNPQPGQVVVCVNILASKGWDLGRSSFLKVGQECLAIGNPFGFDHTLTVGVISGLNRDIFSQTAVTISGLNRDIFSQTAVTIGGGIQTDAAINPGNRF